MGRPHFIWEECFIPEPNSGCWLWLQALNGGGYGTHRGKMAHRYSYELYREKIPLGLTIDHKCRTRCCVNPDHLEVVTMRVNNRRGNGMSGRHFRATHCPKGHPYNELNTYIRPDGMGRGCKICRQLKGIEHAEKQSAAQKQKRIDKLGFDPFEGKPISRKKRRLLTLQQ